MLVATGRATFPHSGGGSPVPVFTDFPVVMRRRLAGGGDALAGSPELGACGTAIAGSRGGGSGR